MLLTRDEWLKQKKRDNTGGTSNTKGQGGRDKRMVRCYNCNILGHYAAECRRPRRLKGQIQEANVAEIDDEEPSLLLAEHKKGKNDVMLQHEHNVTPKITPVVEKKQVESDIWYLDNGASNHMTGQKSKFKSLDEGVTGQVKFGDGSTVKIQGKGSIGFKCKNGEEQTVNEVYYIPSLCNNILSLGQLTEEGNEVVINGEFLRIFDKNKRLLMKVNKSPNRLYKLSIETYSPMCLFTKLEDASWLWHSRLGHENFQDLELMSRKQMARGMPKIVQPKKICHGCLMSKQVRGAFPTKAQYNAKGLLELVHGDLCGPIQPETSAGNKYFFLLVDDYSRVMWVYLLKNKNEALDAFKKFRAKVESGPDKRVKVLRTNRGGEFMSNEFNTYCEEAGITRHYTAPYTPQQNGDVERRNRTVVEMARSYLKEKRVPLYLWGEAIRHSVYVLNRLPTRALTGVTSYKAWTEKKPDVAHIRVFGCLDHMRVPGPQRKKLDDRSMMVINLGKETRYKGISFVRPRRKACLC